LSSAFCQPDFRSRLCHVSDSAGDVPLDIDLIPAVMLGVVMRMLVAIRRRSTLQRGRMLAAPSAAAFLWFVVRSVAMRQWFGDYNPLHALCGRQPLIGGVAVFIASGLNRTLGTRPRPSSQLAEERCGPARLQTFGVTGGW
jgi:hypothetical protein